MTSDEPLKWWKRTEGFLLDARSHLSELAEIIYTDEIDQFNEFMQHNEFKLAINTLEKVINKSSIETFRILEFMALAAASMGLAETQRRYDDELSKARGWKYETVLPPLVE